MKTLNIVAGGLLGILILAAWFALRIVNWFAAMATAGLLFLAVMLWLVGGPGHSYALWMALKEAAACFLIVLLIGLLPWARGYPR